MKKKFSLAFSIFTALFSCTSAVARTTIVFDIHGVLLRDNVGHVIKEKIAALTAQRRGISGSPLFQELAALMAQYRPLGEPVAAYAPDNPVPYEVFALFSGIVTPEEAHAGIKGMLAFAPITDLKREMFTILVDTLFTDEVRESALIPIAAGIALIKALLASPDVDVYIYTNAPERWVRQDYKKRFPEIFAAIPDDHILTSGGTGVMKPSPAVFDIICERAGCTRDEIMLIDDSEANCNSAPTSLLFRALPNNA